MTDPAVMADSWVAWWDREKFKVGVFLGYALALLTVWMAS